MNTERFTVEQVLQALELTGGLIAPAAQKLGCAPNTVRNYLERYPDLQEHLEEIRNATLDLAEGTLLKAIGDGNLTAVIFFLKCRGKDRGYVERQELHGHVTAMVGNIDPGALKGLSDAQLEDIKNGRPPRAESSS